VLTIVSSPTADQLNHVRICCARFSGGTESILMAVKAHRDYYREKKPSVTVPNMYEQELAAPVVSRDYGSRSDLPLLFSLSVVTESAHAAFDKACHYFGIDCIKIGPAPDHRANVAAIRAAITPNTIMVRCSTLQVQLTICTRFVDQSMLVGSSLLLLQAILTV
jgi:glutamate/tyrosine decarboxylase-like PLP-dependent enzyme